MREQFIQRLLKSPLWLLSWRNKKVTPPVGTALLIQNKFPNQHIASSLRLELRILLSVLPKILISLFSFPHIDFTFV